MPTPAEQKALAFVAMVILLGGAIRVVRGGVLTRPTPTVAEQDALARQASAASSSAVSRNAPKAGKSRKASKVARAAHDSGAEHARTGATPATLGPWGFPPPSPRIDVIGRAPLTGPVATPARGHGGGATREPLDLDSATEAEIQQLPRIGPSLARRIVANRDTVGPFGRLEALRRVRGVGASMLEQLAPLVTFSGQVRR